MKMKHSFFDRYGWATCFLSFLVFSMHGLYSEPLPESWTYSLLDGGTYECDWVGGEQFSTFRLSLINGASLVFSGMIGESPVPGVLPEGAWMHLDASCEDSLEVVEQSGVRYVQRWNDVRGTGYPYAIAPSVTSRPIHHSVGGRVCVDFGTLTFGDPAYQGGMTLDWSEVNSSIRSAFVVFSDIAGTDYAQSVLCRARATEPNSFVRGNGSPKGEGALIFNDQDAAPEVLNGNIWFDGRPMDGIAVVDSSCFHQLGVVTTGNSSASAFARDGTIHGGGIRIAECIIYNRALSEDERRQVEAYLAWKWFGRSASGSAAPMAAPFSSIDCAEGTTLNCGNGLRTEGLAASRAVAISGTEFQTTELSAPVLSLSCSKLAVQGLVGDSAWLPEPWAHWDASCADSMEVEEIGGVKYISKWRPVSGTAMGTLYAEAPRVEQRPILAEGAGVLLPFVDFGPMMVNGYDGLTLTWNIACQTVRSVVMVVADPDNENRAGFLGNAWMNTTSYCRNSNGGIINPDVSPLVGTGRLNVNGRAARPTTPFPGGFNIFSSVSSASVGLNVFARDESWWTGGLRIAEVYVFEDVLTDAQMHYLENELSLKWFGHAIDCVTASDSEPDGPAAGAWLHLDAADTNSFTLCNNDVVEWRDRNNGGVLAYVPAYATAPQLVTNGPFNYVDMGVLSFDKEEDLPKGKHLLLNATNENSYTVFVVHSDVEGSEFQNVVGSANPQWVPCYGRGSGGILLNGDPAAAVPLTVLNGFISVDGVEVAGSEYALPQGFHVICFERQRVGGDIHETVRVDAFGCDYHPPWIHAGGQRLAEAIVYDRRLNPSERNRTLAYLLKKYRRESRVRESQVGTLTLSAVKAEIAVAGDRALAVGNLMAAGEVVKSGEGPLVMQAATLSALRLEGGCVQTEGELTLNELGVGSGTIRGNVTLAQDAQVRVAVTDDTQGCIEISGRLTLPGRANLTVEQSLSTYSREEVPLIRCGDIVGSGTWTGAIAGDKTCRVRVVTTETGLALRYFPSGLEILIR